MCQYTRTMFEGSAGSWRVPLDGGAGVACALEESVAGPWPSSQLWPRELWLSSQFWPSIPADTGLMALASDLQPSSRLDMVAPDRHSFRPRPERGGEAESRCCRIRPGSGATRIEADLYIEMRRNADAQGV